MSKKYIEANILIEKGFVLAKVKTDKIGEVVEFMTVNIEDAPCVDFEEIKTECAKEIFEEIERKLPNDFPFLGTAVAVYLEELKKKYTEKGGNNNA